MAITSINPATNEAIRTYEELTPDATAAAIVQAHETWLKWRTVPFDKRSALMKRAAEILRERKNGARPAHDGGDGQAAQAGRSGSGEMRAGFATTTPRTQSRSLRTR